MGMIANLIKDILEQGLTETELVERLEGKGVHITQQSINKIKTGRIRSARYDVGAAITALHSRICRRRRQK